MKRRVAAHLILAFVLLTQTACQGGNQEYLDNFEVVWQTVNDSFPDPTFGGVDWRAVHDRYQPLIAAATNDGEFYDLLNSMLFKLNVSHAVVGAPGEGGVHEPVVLAEGSPGLDLRVLDEQAVISFVRPGSPAEAAGIRSGYIVQAIEGVTVAQIISDEEQHLVPPFNERGRAEVITRKLLGRIYGPAGTLVRLAYLDEEGQAHAASLLREKRPRVSTTLENWPATYLEFESRLLENGIGYIRFNMFHPDLLADFRQALQSMIDAPGLIIDLRGNPGGNLDAMLEMISQFLGERTSVLTLRTRSESSEIVLEPTVGSYQGPLVVLVDVRCTSGSEAFPGSLQVLGRAVVVGQRTPGSVTGGQPMFLPNGAFFMYPFTQVELPDGTNLEGRGVIPDIEVALDRALLLQGRDSQLEAAIDYLEQR